MRVGFDASVASGQPGGTGTYATQLLKALVPLHPEWTYYLYFRNLADANPLLTTPAGDNVVRVPVPGRLNVARMQLSMPGQLVRDRIDLYHSPGYFLPLRWPGPKIVTIHDLNVYLQLRSWLRRGKLTSWADLSVQTPLSAGVARRIIVDSTSAKQDVMRLLRVRADRVRVIPLAPDPYFDEAAAADDLAAAQQITGGRPFILFVGILSPQKNLEGLVRAFATSGIWRSGVELVMAGADHEGYARELRAAALRENVAGAVRLPGYVPRSTLRGLYASTTCLVLPSHGEGFGLPMVEAMACGSPILAANRQALPEVLDGGGQLFDPAKLDDLSALLRRVSEDAAFQSELRQRAKTRRQDFSWEKTAQATAEVYAEVMHDA
jgi:glycosyltransferase involved in cell wall biosynthesis